MSVISCIKNVIHAQRNAYFAGKYHEYQDYFKKKGYPIGQTYDVYKVVLDWRNECQGCAFIKDDNKCIKPSAAGPCAASKRADNKSIKFIKL